MIHRILLITTALVSTLAAQKPSIFIISDMEGVGGVYSWDEQVAPGQRRFEESRRLLTGEINAAVDGALEGGAGEVVVWDGHDGHRSLSIEDIHPQAKLIQGPHTGPDFYMQDKHFDGLMFIGQHPMAGAPNGILAHSAGRNIRQIWINETLVGEIGYQVAIAGYYGVPSIMLSGDQAACDELLALQPKAETAAVKQLSSHKGDSISVVSLSHTEAKSLIRLRARRAVERIKEFSPWVIRGPVTMRFEYAPEVAESGEVKQPPSRIYKGATLLDVYQQWTDGSYGRPPRQ